MGKKCIVADPEEEATEEQYSEDEDEVDEGGMGTLRVDVNQALEELDELIDEFRRTIPVE